VGYFRFYDMPAIRWKQELLMPGALELNWEYADEWPTVLIEAVDLKQAHKIAQIRGLSPDDSGFLARKGA
jgi:hypothetical protein